MRESGKWGYLNASAGLFTTTFSPHRSSSSASSWTRDWSIWKAGGGVVVVMAMAEMVVVVVVAREPLSR